MSVITFTPVTIFQIYESCVVTSHAVGREPTRYLGRGVKIVRRYGSDGSLQRNVYIEPRSYKRDTLAITEADYVIVEQDGRVLFDTREAN